MNLATRLATLNSKLTAIQQELEREGVYSQDITDAICLVEKLQNEIEVTEDVAVLASTLHAVLRIVTMLGTYYNQS